MLGGVLETCGVVRGRPKEMDLRKDSEMKRPDEAATTLPQIRASLLKSA